MEHRNNDPGAVQYGNFINYYTFNNAAQRLKLLPRDVWLATESTPTTQPYLVLDVGCNAGNLTQLLYTFLEECVGRTIQIFGIDIDEGLVERANIENKYPQTVSYTSMDVMDSKAFEKVKDYLREQNRQTFDAVCCFSITMWIHLNHGDKGLAQFLHKLCDVAELFVLEPQPWKCYQTAVKRMRRAGYEFPLFPDLLWRSNVEECIEEVLENKLSRKKVFKCLPTRWQRHICFYR